MKHDSTDCHNNTSNYSQNSFNFFIHYYCLLQVLPLFTINFISNTIKVQPLYVVVELYIVVYRPFICKFCMYSFIL